MRAVGEPISHHLRDLDWQKIWSADKDEWRKVFTHELEVFYPQQRYISFYIVPVADEQNSVVTGMAIILRDVTETRQRAEWGRGLLALGAAGENLMLAAADAGLAPFDNDSGKYKGQ